jgi:hypothetical protein
MEKLRYIKTDRQFKKGSIVEVTELVDDVEVKSTYAVIESSDLFNPDDDGYVCTILEEIKR